MTGALPRFKRDYRTARRHPEFDAETLEYVFDVMISGGKLPDSLREHRLAKRRVNWARYLGYLADGLGQRARSGLTETQHEIDVLPCNGRSSRRL